MNQMKFFVVLLLLSSVAFAVEPKEIGSSEIKMDLYWHIAGTAPGVKVLKTFSYPNTTFQTVFISSNSSFKTERDKFGNEILVFEWTQDKPKTIWLRVRALVDYDVHFVDASEGDAEKFSQQTKLVLLDDSITTQSSLLSQNSVSAFEKLTKFTEWAHNSITYDDAFWLRQPRTTDIFIQRKGVCNQYSHMAMALLRAQGIPSRFVAGWVYSGKEWGPHAWVEVLLDGKWVAADPTYNEVEFLDGSHVVFAYTFDQSDVKEELTRGLQMTKTQDVELVSFQLPREFFKIFVDAPEKVGSLAAEKIKVRIENGDEKPHAIPLLLSVPSEPKELEVKIVGSSSKLVFLPSSGVAETQWNVLFPKLSEDFIYNFTVQVSSLGVKEKKAIAGNPEILEEEKQRILLTTMESVQTGKEIAVVATLANAGNADTRASVSVVLGNQTQSQSILLKKGETQQARFNFLKPLSSSKGTLSISTSKSTTTNPFEIVEAPGAQEQTQGVVGMEAIAVAGAVILVLLAVLWFFFKRRA